MQAFLQTEHEQGAYEAELASAEVLDHELYRNIARLLGDQLTDPDHRYYIESGLYAARDRLDFLLRHSIKSVTLTNTSHYFIYLVKHRAGDIIARPMQGVKLLLVHLTVFALFWTFTGPLGYLLFWLIPYFTAFQVIGWFSEVSEHFGMFGVYKDEVKMTRNRFPSLIERIFIGVHGDNYHRSGTISAVLATH